jgi:dTDP-4-dehydrorhamnose reductase
MLGQDLCAAACSAGHDVVALARADLDITDHRAVAATIVAERPDAVVNCAAWTDVDGAESASNQALEVNGIGAGAVAAGAYAAGAWTIQISSDYVFDGSKGAGYVESDPVAPLSAYGRSKLAGELAVSRTAPGRHTIVRSAWLFGAGGQCFPATILRLAAERDELTVVDDQIGSPTFTGHLAQALVELAGAQIVGTLHVACAGRCSWFQFAQEIVTLSALSCEVRPGRTENLGRPAPRPAFSALESERGAPALPHWLEGLESFLQARVGS